MDESFTIAIPSSIIPPRFRAIACIVRCICHPNIFPFIITKDSPSAFSPTIVDIKCITKMPSILLSYRFGIFQGSESIQANTMKSEIQIQTMKQFQKILRKLTWIEDPNEGTGLYLSTPTPTSLSFFCKPPSESNKPESSCPCPTTTTEEMNTVDKLLMPYYLASYLRVNKRKDVEKGGGFLNCEGAGGITMTHPYQIHRNICLGVSSIKQTVGTVPLSWSNNMLANPVQFQYERGKNPWDKFMTPFLTLMKRELNTYTYTAIQLDDAGTGKNNPMTVPVPVPIPLIKEEDDFSEWTEQTKEENNNDVDDNDGSEYTFQSNPIFKQLLNLVYLLSRTVDRFDITDEHDPINVQITQLMNELQIKNNAFSTHLHCVNDLFTENLENIHQIIVSIHRLLLFKIPRQAESKHPMVRSILEQTCCNNSSHSNNNINDCIVWIQESGTSFPFREEWIKMIHAYRDISLWSNHATKIDGFTETWTSLSFEIYKYWTYLVASWFIHYQGNNYNLRKISIQDRSNFLSFELREYFVN